MVSEKFDAPILDDKQLQDRLEGLIDGNNMERVLEALQHVCSEKADHIASNWQDKNAAKPWTRQSKLLDKARAEAVKDGI